MQTLALSLRNRGEEGEPLPGVYRQLEVMGARIRRGQLTLVAGAPGGGKSALMSYYALKADWTGQGDRIPTLYFSADSDKLTFGKAAVAASFGIHTTEAEKLLNDGNEEALEKLDEVTDHLWVSFQAAPSPRDIHEEVLAFATVYGEYPTLCVVDNLMDVDSEGGGMDERTSHDAVLDVLKRWAREYSMAVVVLCHVVGQYDNGNQIIPLSGLMQKISKRPRLVLTLHRAGDNLLGISVVKNSSGRAMADGSYLTHIPWLPELSWFGQENNQ